MSKKAVAELYRIAWHTVGEIADRVWRRHITVVVDHDRRCVIWTHEGYGKEVLQLFMNELSEKQRAGVELVTCDGAKWIRSCIEENLPNAERCVDGFHVVQWATDALGEVRAEAWNDARKKRNEPKRGRGRPAAGTAPKDRSAEEIKNSRYALDKAPENLTESQQKKLELIANRYPKLYRAYQLKEELRTILKMPYPDAVVNLDRWLWRASHSRIEATNNKIKLLIRTAYGFRDMENMLSLIMLSCSYVEVKIAYKWEAECQKSSNKAA